MSMNVRGMLFTQQCWKRIPLCPKRAMWRPWDRTSRAPHVPSRKTPARKALW